MIKPLPKIVSIRCVFEDEIDFRGNPFSDIQRPLVGELEVLEMCDTAHCYFLADLV